MATLGRLLFAHGKQPALTALRAFTSSCISPDIGLTDEQKEYREAAINFAKTALSPKMQEWDLTEEFPIDVIKQSAELGFGGLFVSEEFGGLGLKRLDGSVVFEALSQGCVSTSAFITIHNMVNAMIDSFGTNEQREKFIPDLCAMNKLASYCLTEPGSGSDAAALVTSAKREGNKYIVNGSKAFISGAGATDLMVVMTRTGSKGPKGISALIMDARQPGITFGQKEKKVGWNNQPTCIVNFDDVEVPVENLLGKEGEGFNLAMHGLNGGRINIASCSLGAAQQCMEDVLQYTNDRKAFSQPLHGFQNVQFKLADMATKLTTSRLIIREAARALDNKDANAVAMCAMCKLYATENLFDLIDEALQLHGGYGYLKSYPVQQFWRDTRVNRILEGTSEVMHMIVARDLLKHL